MLIQLTFNSTSRRISENIPNSVTGKNLAKFYKVQLFSIITVIIALAVL